MTPKEKANELIEKFLLVERESSEMFNAHIDYFLAVQCAIVLVDEIDSIYQKLTQKDDPYCYLIEFEYWQDVKKELEKLPA